jgi:hypothetical protein
MTYENNPNTKPVPPIGSGKSNRTTSPATWVLGAIAVVVVLVLATMGLTGNKTEPNNTAITSTPNTTGAAPATPPQR